MSDKKSPTEDLTQEEAEDIEKVIGLIDDEDSFDKINDAFDVYMLAKGVAFDGHPYWAYMVVPPGNLIPFQQEQASGNNALLDYGHILALGYGEEPPEDVRKRMEEKYEINHDFEKEVIEGAQKIYEEEYKNK